MTSAPDPTPGTAGSYDGDAPGEAVEAGRQNQELEAAAELAAEVVTVLEDDEAFASVEVLEVEDEEDGVASFEGVTVLEVDEEFASVEVLEVGDEASDAASFEVVEVLEVEVLVEVGGPDAVDPAELDAIEAALASVGAALERLAEGSYGSCEICGRAVSDDALADDPTATRCPDHLPLPAGTGPAASARGTPGSAMSATGTPATGTPATGTPATGTPGA